MSLDVDQMVDLMMRVAEEIIAETGEPFDLAHNREQIAADMRLDPKVLSFFNKFGAAYPKD